MGYPVPMAGSGSALKSSNLGSGISRLRRSRREGESGPREPFCRLEWLSIKEVDMSNPFKWFVYVSVDGGPWYRHREFANSMKGAIEAEREAAHFSSLVGIEAKIERERKGEATTGGQ